MRKIVSLLAAFATLAAVAPAAPAAAAGPIIRFDSAQYDSPGPDDHSHASLAAEWIAVVNAGPRLVDLTGWEISDASGKKYRFDGVKVRSRQRVTLHTGRGRDTASDVYWGSGAYIWNNTGDVATLRDPAGRTVDTCSWKFLPGRTLVAC